MGFLKTVTVIAISLGLLTACGQQAPENRANKIMLSAIDTLFEVYNSREVDKLDAIAAPNYTRRAPDQNANSLAELKAFINQIYTTYPDFKLTNDGMAAGSGGGFVKWTATGTNTGEGATPPTGKAFKLTGISNYQFVDGKMVNEFVAFDSAVIAAQLATEELPHTTD